MDIHLPSYGGSFFVTKCGKKFERCAYLVSDVTCEKCLELHKANSYNINGETMTEAEYEKQLDIQSSRKVGNA